MNEDTIQTSHDIPHPKQEPLNMTDASPGVGMESDDAQDDKTTEREALIERIRLLEEELMEGKDKHLRQLADIENMRRRHEKERGDLLKFASEKLLQDLLPVLDSFDKAFSLESTNSGMIEGMRMVHKQLFHILEQHGLKPVETKAAVFDPNLHQAIQRVEIDDAEEEKIQNEFQRGYTLNGRLIRPSMVSVTVPKTSD